MQGNYNYNYIPETNHVSMVYSVAAVLFLQFMLHVVLFILVKFDLRDFQVMLLSISEFREALSEIRTLLMAVN